ncbi:GtrA family protein [Alicyclobacillus sp. SO9]|nr:GtrA family protein [Alicyclobacillus sp. SO9]
MQYTGVFRHSIKRYTKFLLVGAANAFVDLLVLNVLMLLTPNATAVEILVYNTIAVMCAIANSYFWNRRWTFADTTDGSVRERLLFFFQALINIGLNDVIVVLLSTYLIFSKSVPVFVSSNAAKGLAMFLSSSVSYLFMRLFVFRSSKR